MASSSNPSPKKRKIESSSLEPVHYQALQGGRSVPPPDLKQISNILKHLGTGQGVIPSSERAWMMEEHEDSPFRDVPSWAYTDDATGQGFGPCPDRGKIAKVLRHAEHRHATRHHEASWNSAVHERVFEMAFDNEHWHERLYYANVTKVDILAQYLPKDAAGKPMPAKMIDYVLSLQIGGAFLEALQKLRIKYADNGITWNHVDYTPINDLPIVAGVETKTTGESYQQARVQLATWGALQLNKLETMMADPSRIEGLPFLPLIMIQGHEWYFLAMTKSNKSADLWEKIALGSTDNPVGVYSIVAALQRLGKWCDENYRAWFKENVVGPMQ